MNGRGFLGTNANLLQDLSLVLGILVALTLTVGVVMAVRKRYEVHRWIQTVAVSLNILQVLTIMVGSFLKSAAPGIPQRLGETYYSSALIHASIGLITLLFGTFVMLRGNKLVPRGLQFRNYKLFMRTAYTLYMAVTLLGLWVYYNWYVNAPQPAVSAGAQPVAQRQNELLVPMANFVFNPQDVVVPVGATVIWVNQDGAPHTATADPSTSSGPAGTLFKSELLSTGQQFRHTFDQIGEFPYYCELHGSAGGVDMAGKIKVVPADQAPPLVAAAPALAEPTPQPTPGALPAKYFGQPVGTAAFRDDKARSDQIVLAVKLDSTPPANQSLVAFLTTIDNSASQNIGELKLDEQGGAQLSYSAPDGQNLAARFNRFVISQEPTGSNPPKPAGTIVFEGQLPGQAFQFLNQLLANGPGLPAQQGYVTGLRLQTDELLRHAQFVADAQTHGDLAGAKRHAEHVYNLIAGSRDPRFGDLNGDGRSQNPGDGFGLLQNGDQSGYIKATDAAAAAALAATDATDAIKAHSEHVRITAANMQGWATEARDLALALASAGDVAAAKDQAARLLTLSQWINLGDDANGDGQIAPIPGEGGGIVAYEHAQFMAGFGLFPAKAAAVPQGLVALVAYRAEARAAQGNFICELHPKGGQA
jgi:plastocyanin